MDYAFRIPENRLFLIPHSSFREFLQRFVPPRDRWRHWSKKVLAFGRWQLAAQGLQLLTGLCLVRWLNYDGYAQYGLVVGFQIMLALLVDLGFTEAVVALIGTRIDDRFVVGRYIATAWANRTKVMLIVTPVAAIVFAQFSRLHHWPFVESLGLFASIIAFLFFQGWGAISLTPLLMHQEISRIYLPRISASTAVLAMNFFLHSRGLLSPLWICWMNVASLAATGLYYRGVARRYFAWEEKPSPETQREMRCYLAPLLAGTVFYALHGQIQTFLIGWFGGSQSIAEVTALGRIGQILAFGSAFVYTLLVPVVARAPASRLPLRYAQSVALVVLFSTTLLGAAALFPTPFLLILGPRYSGLHSELLLVVAGSVAAFISGSLYMFNNARKWATHTNVAFSMAGALLIDVAFLAYTDLSQVKNVLVLAFFSNLFPLIPYSIIAWRGCSREAPNLSPRRLEEVEIA